MSLKLTRMIERTIVGKIISEAIKAGLSVTVSYGERDCPVTYSTDRAAILKAMWACDEEWLVFHAPDEAKTRRGWVRLIYGNGNNGCDVVCDYSTLIEPVMKPANDLALELEKKWG